MAAMTLRLDDELYQRLRKTAFDRREPISRLIRDALLAWLEQESDDGV